MTDIETKLLKFAKMLRSAAYWCNDGYYASESESAANSAKRDVYEEIASSLDAAFEFDSTMTPSQLKDWRYSGG
jgi:hypothetical protein